MSSSRTLENNNESSERDQVICDPVYPEEVTSKLKQSKPVIDSEALQEYSPILFGEVDMEELLEYIMKKQTQDDYKELFRIYTRG